MQPVVSLYRFYISEIQQENSILKICLVLSTNEHLVATNILTDIRHIEPPVDTQWRVGLNKAGNTLTV
jgi:hypothetical protein